MQALTADVVQRSFVNSTKSRVRSMTLPDLATTPWPDLDFLGWRDRRADQRAYLVAPQDDRLVGVELRAPTRGGRRGLAMCELCRSSRPGTDVDLFVAPRAGSRGKDGDTIGTYICADLGCSLLLREKRRLEGHQGWAALSPQERVDGLLHRVSRFLEDVLS